MQKLIGMDDQGGPEQYLKHEYINQYRSLDFHLQVGRFHFGYPGFECRLRFIMENGS